MGHAFRVVAVGALVAALGLPLAGSAGAQPPQMADVIVVLHDGVDARTAAREMARSHDARIGHIYEHALSGFAAEVPEGRLAGLERDARVDYVNENRVLHAVDAEYPTGVERIDSDQIHGTIALPNVTGTGVRVAVIDTGIDLDHPDLGTVAPGRDCVNNDSVADDDQGHGTHVAGTVAAKRNNGQVVGVAPDATLVPVKVLSSTGSGTWAQVICGIDYVTNQGNIDVANMSLGAAGSFDGLSCGSSSNNDALFDAICRSVEAGTTYTVAAGNDGKNASGFVPAAHPSVITVSAFSDTDGQFNSSTTCSGKGPWKTCDEAFASFSNYGSVVDVIAPGVSILSTTYDGKTGTKSGTSMAAPHVAGVAALVLQASPTLAPAAVAARLQDTGQCPDGLVNGATTYCSGQGGWNSDPDSPATEPMVNALWAVTYTTGGGAVVTAPAAPSDLNATTVSSSQIDLSWTDNSTDEDGFEIERSDGTSTDIVTVGPGVTTYSHTDLTADTPHTYRVRAYNTAGTSAWSLAASATTSSAEPTTGIALSATGYKVKGVQHAELSWTGTAGTVHVYRDGTLIATTTKTSHVDNLGSKGGGSYRYHVCEGETCSNTVTVTF